MRKNRGFALTDLALALGILGIVSAVPTINLFKDQKQKRAKEIASVLTAIDQGFNTLALSQQIIPPYRGETSPMPYPTLTTSANDETMYVRIIRETYGKGIANSSGQTLSLADYRANLKDLARRGHTLTFNITGGYTLSTISVSGIDDELNNYLSGILGDRWDKQSKAFKLNNGSGYTFRPFYINKVVGYTSGSNGPIAKWDNVFVGYRLDNGREPVQTHANNPIIPAIYEEGGSSGSGSGSGGIGGNGIGGSDSICTITRVEPVYEMRPVYKRKCNKIRVGFTIRWNCRNKLVGYENVLVGYRTIEEQRVCNSLWIRPTR